MYRGKTAFFPPTRKFHFIPPHSVKSIPDVLLGAVIARLLVQTTSPLEALKKIPSF
jgi:hypothetical protein